MKVRMVSIHLKAEHHLAGSNINGECQSAYLQSLYLHISDLISKSLTPSSL